MSVYEGDRSGPASVGCVAGDAQSYILFCDFFDRVIEAYHEHKITSQTPESDFNYDNLKVAAQTTGCLRVSCSSPMKNISYKKGWKRLCQIF